MHAVDPDCRRHASPLTPSNKFSLLWIWTRPKVALELEFMNASHGVMWFHLARRTKRNWVALEVTWMQNSDRELLNQHFLFHLGAEKKALGRAEEGKGRESEMGGEIKRNKKKERKQRVGGGNRQDWRVIMSTLARGAKCWNISNWISFWADGGGGGGAETLLPVLTPLLHSFLVRYCQISSMNIIWSDSNSPTSVGPFTWISIRLYSTVQRDLMYAVPYALTAWIPEGSTLICNSWSWY